MSGFNGQNFRGDGQDCRHLNQGSCSKVPVLGLACGPICRGSATYAETPMFSKFPAVATIAAAVVKPKL